MGTYLYRRLLALLPRAFRHRNGAEMDEIAVAIAGESGSAPGSASMPT